MKKYFENLSTETIEWYAIEYWGKIKQKPANFEEIGFMPICSDSEILYKSELPLPNLWLGVSVENQKQADKRIPYLLKTPAKVRFLSCEPLLGHIDLNRIWNDTKLFPNAIIDVLRGRYNYDFRQNGVETNKIDWVIVGKNVSPMHTDWVREIRNQCKAAGVPFYLKNGLLDGKEYNELPQIIVCKYQKLK